MQGGVYTYTELKWVTTAQGWVRGNRSELF